MRLLRRLGWASLDQGIASFSNLLLSITVASQSTKEEFGAFGIIFATYLVIIGIGRSLVGDPVLLGFSSWHTEKIRRNNRVGMISGLILLGLLAGIVLVIVSFLVPSTLRMPFIALACTIPGLLALDGLRYWSFASGKAMAATILDSGWLVCQVVLFILLLSLKSEHSFMYFAAWGISANICCLVFLIYNKWTVELKVGVSWIRENLHTSLNFLGEYVTLSGVQQGVTFITAAVAGLSAIGTLRAAQTILGPANIITGSASVVVLPQSSRIAKSNIRKLPLFSAGVSAGLALVVLCAVVVVVAVPQNLGQVLFGESWVSGQQAAKILAVALGLNALTYGATSGLRALQLSRVSLRVRVVTAPLSLGAVAYGAMHSGAQGALLGLAISAGVIALVWWSTYLVYWRSKC